MGRRPCIESLENRKLLSVTWSHHVVTVIGPARAPNTITVGLNPGGASIFATLSYPGRKGVVTQTKTFALSQSIHMINIGGGQMCDMITIDQTNGSFPFLTHISTHAGNDTVMGGDEPDRIICGSGIDAIMSGAGSDTLQAGRGPDTLVGGDGNDVLHAGPGHDLLVGGDGDNTFIDPYGHVTLQGGSGHDTYVLKSIQLDPVNNYTPTKDTLKHYVPPKGPNTLLKDILNGFLDYGSFI